MVAGHVPARSPTSPELTSGRRTRPAEAHSVVGSCQVGDCLPLAGENSNAGARSRDFRQFRDEHALSPKPWGALEFTPGLTCPTPNMRGLGVMMANGIACGAGGVAAGLALSLDLEQTGRHANVVDVAEHVLQSLQLVDKLLALALVEERRHELGLVAQLL